MEQPFKDMKGQEKIDAMTNFISHHLPFGYPGVIEREWESERVRERVRNNHEGDGRAGKN
jgi:hypothetical protein